MGTVLLDEAPLFVGPADQRPAEAVAAFERLPQRTRSAILKLAGNQGAAATEIGFEGEQLAFLRVLRTNSVALPGGGGAIYPLSCRANHSCRPNVSLRTSADGRIRLVALRPIAAREEVLASYIGEGELLRPAHRRQALLRNWGFQCGCERCRKPDDTRGFNCPACGHGTVYPHPSEQHWSACTSCGASPSSQSLGQAEQEWSRHVAALRGAHSDLMAAAMYDGLASSVRDGTAPTLALDGHWIAFRLAASATAPFRPARPWRGRLACQQRGPRRRGGGRRAIR